MYSTVVSKQHKNGDKTDLTVFSVVVDNPSATVEVETLVAGVGVGTEMVAGKDCWPISSSASANPLPSLEVDIAAASAAVLHKTITFLCKFVHRPRLVVIAILIFGPIPSSYCWDWRCYGKLAIFINTNVLACVNESHL